MIPYSIIEEENKFLVKDRKYEIRRQGLYPSESSVKFEIDGVSHVVGKCFRAVYWRATGEPKSNPAGPKLNMTAAIGKAIEEVTIDRWKSIGIWDANNVKFFDANLVLSGEVDIVIKAIPELQKIIGIEHKTFYGQNADYQIYGKKGLLKKDGTYSDSKPRILGMPKEDQFLQSVIYAHKYVNELKLMDEFRLYYINRGSGDRAEFVVGADKQEDGTHRCYWQQVPGDYWNAYTEEKIYRPYTIEDIHARPKELIKYIRNKELPPRDFNYNPDDNWVDWALKNNIISTSAHKKHMSRKQKYHPFECDYCFWKDKCLKLKD
jgi:hypothetical protein